MPEAEEAKLRVGVFMRTQGLARKLPHYLSFLRGSLHPKYALANVVCGLLPNFVSGIVRARVYRWAGLDIDKSAFIMGNLEVTSALSGFYDKLSIRAGTVVSTKVTINVDDTVRIGTNVCISPYVLIYTGSHSMGPSWKRMGPITTKPVTIEDGAWVRLGAIILPGVTVGRGSVVGAGAVVFEDVPPNSYVAGNPARVLRELPDENRG